MTNITAIAPDRKEEVKEKIQGRISSLDFLKGLVMVIMALDHVRDYFHYDAFFNDPTDVQTTTVSLFFTRFISHFCAPAFSLLAGLSAYLVGRRKSKSELSKFLFTRGLWLIFIEVTIVSFAWHFDPYFTRTGLMVIWSLGVSMLVLAGLIHLPLKVILTISLLIIFGHNLLDGIDIKDNFFWSILHQRNSHYIDDVHYVGAIYAFFPWVAVMALGYCFGPLYNKEFDQTRRKKWLNTIGLGSLAMFFVLTLINGYGDPVKWVNSGLNTKTLFSFLNVSKYPASLRYLLLTLGGTFLFMANTEKIKGKFVEFISVFGRVPFFYYILHLYLIHILALLAAELTGFGWESMILKAFVTMVDELQGYGFSLPVVYLVWVTVILLLYPVCKKFDSYKQSHKEKWWLSYL